MKISHRILFLIILTITVLSVSNYVINKQQITAIHLNAEKILVRTTLQSIRDVLARDVVTGNKLRVTNMLRSMLLNNTPIEFIYITNTSHDIFAHSFTDGFPRYLLQNKRNVAKDSFLIHRYKTSEGLINEYSEALIKGLDINLHIGINQSESIEQLYQYAKTSFQLTLVVTLFIMIIAYFWNMQITKPLTDFAEQVRLFGSGGEFILKNIQKNLPEINTLTEIFSNALNERELAVQKLKKNEQNLSITLHSIGDAVITTDEKGNITRVNPVAEHLTGWKNEEAYGKSIHTVFNIIDANTREIIENPVERVLKTGKTVHLSNNTTLVSKNGNEYQITDSAAPIRQGSSPLLGMVLVFNDITEQYKLRKAAELSENKLKTLATVAPVGIFYTSKTGDCLYVNEKWCEITGIPATEASGNGWVRGLHPDDRQYVFDEWNKMLKDDKPFKIEYRFFNGNETSWVLGQALARNDDHGELIGFTGTITDITDRKKIEKALQSSTQHLNYAQRMANIGSWDLNIKGDILSWSDELYRIFDIDPSDPTPLYDLFLKRVHPDDIDYVRTAYTDSVKNKTNYNIDHRLLMPDGSIKYVNERCKTYYDDSGKPFSSVGTVQDITEQVNLQETLRRTQKMDALGQLTGGIAHDYNNMLGIILGYSELLEGPLKENPTLARYVKEIRTASERGSKLTKKLLDFSQNKKLDASIFNINNLLNDRQLMLEKTLTSRIKLTLDLSDDLWPIYIDSNEFEDAIINLSINSMHAISETGQLTMKTSNIQVTESHSSNLKIAKGDYVLLEITDTGCGINKDDLEKIFDPFYSTKGRAGTGLGLSQVYGFVERNHGVIQVESQVSKGTKFKLYFPRTLLPLKIDSLPTTKTNKKLDGTETILIVDDEQAMITLAKEILKSNGYKVLTAISGEAALSVLEKNTVDLVLTDVIMPNMDGYQLAHKIQSLYPNTKIQIMSGYTDDKHKSVETSLLHKNILYKPYSKHELLYKIRTSLDANEVSDQKTVDSNRSILVMDDEPELCELFKLNLERLGYRVYLARDGKTAIATYQEKMQNNQPIDAVILDLNIPGGEGGIDVAQKIHHLDPAAKLIVSSGQTDGDEMVNFQNYGFVAAIEKNFDRKKLSETLQNILG